MMAYTMQAEDDDVAVVVTFKKAETPSDATPTGNVLVAKPLLGVAHFLRALLVLRGGAGYPQACRELADFFDKSAAKYLGVEK